jgi:MoaA/NifB/PqqE/SkfB family radical SAM enzyme/SAM-dependent methyltransferase
MKALIKVGYSCNEHCTFCHTQDVRHIDGSADEVHAKIERAKQLGHTMVVLSGGEPTIRPELLTWAKHIASLDMDLGFVTNGQMLAYPKLVDRLLSLRLRYVYMSLHGGTATIHERLTRTEGFDRTVRALDNLTGRGLDLTVNTVVTKRNVDHLIGVVDRVLGYDDVLLKFSMVQPKGGGKNQFGAVMPRVADVAARVREALAYGLDKRRDRGPRFGHDGIPLCLLSGYEELYDDLKTHRFATMVDIGEPDFFPVDDRAKVQPPDVCHGCPLGGPCPGLFRGYAERFGTDELQPPASAPVSNSYHFVFHRRLPLAVSDGCPVRVDGVTPWDQGRDLLVLEDGAISLYRAATRDFSDEALRVVKQDLGQVYVDVSGKDAPTDFATDLRKLSRSAWCVECPERSRCTGTFESVREDVFTRDDARVREMIEGLTGDVLDVGCGEGRYTDLLAPMVKRGAISYLGLDPDAEAVARLTKRCPDLPVRVGDAEGIDPSMGGFDHILMLRSWNHLRDPDLALEAVRAVAREGAQLIVCDNVAFGLARKAAHARRAESSSARFEHYRNDDAEQALAVLGRAGFPLLERIDVGPETSNQWLLRVSVRSSAAQQ